MNLRSIYLANGVGVFILLMLQYTSRTKLLRRRIEDRIYSFTVLGVMAACVLEAFSYAIEGKVFPGARLLNYLANTYLFSVNLLLPFCVLVYIDLFFFPILIGAALQSLFYGLSVAWLAAAIGLVGMFMMQQNELAYVDSLTDTYNRQYLSQIISAWTARGSSFSGVMLDVDGFMKDLDDRMYRMKALHHGSSRAPDSV